MDLRNILTLERTFKCASCQSKKRTLEEISSIFASHLNGPSAHEIFDSLIERERLGSTGLGDGIAIPHCRLASCTEPTGTFLLMDCPIDFDSLDRQKVDLVFALVVPQEATDDHLNILANIATKLSDPSLRERLRSAPTAIELHQILTSEMH